MLWSLPQDVATDRVREASRSRVSDSPLCRASAEMHEWPGPTKNNEDSDLKEVYDAERQLLYVACTRGAELLAGDGRRAGVGIVWMIWGRRFISIQTE